jgi:AraC-like DNA-binding protein
MAYCEYPIAADLKPIVKVIWSMENDLGDVSPFSMRILPDACVELVIHYFNPFSTTFSNGECKVQPESFVVAQMKSFIELSPNGAYGFMSIRFSAQGAYHFFGSPMKAIVNGVVELGDVWGSFANELTYRVRSATTGTERSDIIQRFLLLKLSQNGNFDKAVDYSINELFKSNGKLSIEQLAVNTGLSNRQLVRRFDQKIGISPKEFATIIRFMYATQLLKAKTASIYDVSYLSGYYDHAHFFHDFKKFSGLNPRQFQERYDVFL